MRNFPTRDVVLGVVAVGCIVLIALGIDGEIKALLGVIVGFYIRGLAKKV